MTTSDSRYTAVVSMGEEIAFVAATDSSTALAARLVDYIGGRCDHVLWPRDAAAVHALIAARKLDEAIALYFSSVGQRWDVERLEIGGHAEAVSLSAARPRN
jgi:hypothetical protein